MTQHNDKKIQNNELLKEIFAVPSEKIITDRFNAESSAHCSGNCGTGTCEGLV